MFFYPRNFYFYTKCHWTWQSCFSYLVRFVKKCDFCLKGIFNVNNNVLKHQSATQENGASHKNVIIF